MEASLEPRQPKPRRAHIGQIDLLRIVPMVMVVATHTVMFTQGPGSRGGNAALFVLHVSRFLFFFITAFVLFYQYGDGRQTAPRFWRKRYPPIVVPYVLWTVVYWLINPIFPWSGQGQLIPGGLPTLGLNLAQGWFHLYFLIVTMQFYLVFPAFAWLIRRTAGWHWLLLAAGTLIELVWTGFFAYEWHLIPAAVHAATSKAQIELPVYEFFFLVGALAAVNRERLMGWVRTRRWSAAAVSAGALAISGVIYVVNLDLMATATAASQVFQPAILLLFIGGVLGLWLIADVILSRFGPEGAPSRLIRGAAGLSFGIYLSHMVTLQLVVLAQGDNVLDMGALSGAPWTVVCWTLAVAGAALISWVLSLTPLSWALTGRPRRALVRRPLPDAIAA